jgi:hypothetical protein
MDFYNLLENPPFLNLKDNYYYFEDDKIKIEKKKNYKVNDKKLFNSKSYIYKSDFSPVTNKHTAIIEYIEENPMFINGFAMPCNLTLYSKNFNFDQRKIVKSEDDLPLLTKMGEKNLLIQENNLFSSILRENPKVYNCSNIYLLTFVKSSNSPKNEDVECFIDYNPKLFLSGHIQPKIECGVTFSKQENNIFKRERSKFNKNLLNSLEKTHSQNNNKYNIQPIQIKSIREISSKFENKRIKRFFKYLLKNGNFSDENQIFIILYTLSCFILHDEEMKSILNKVENFINSLDWTQSINFFNVIDKSKLGKNYFQLRLLKIFYNYFELSELLFFDEILLNYIKKFNEVKKEFVDNDQQKLAIGSNYDENIQKKKNKFYIYKKRNNKIHLLFRI